MQELSQVRDALLREGDLYSLQRGHIALAVPVFGSYALAEYERARGGATAELTGLEQMRLNTGSAGHRQPLPPS